VVNGSDWTLASQMRLLPGVYSRRKDNGEIESHVNVMPGQGLSHRIQMDPESGVFKLKVGGSEVPLLPILRALGVPRDRIREAWGGLTAANEAKADPRAVGKFHDKLVRSPRPDDPRPPEERIREALESMPLDPRVTRSTLGREFDRITPDVYLAATRKLIGINRGEVDPDDRDHLGYMKVLGQEDLISERVLKDLAPLRRALWKATMSGGDLKALAPGLFTKSLMAAIQSSGLGQPNESVNPSMWLEQMGRVSRMGVGGIADADAIPAESQAVQPSHLGYMDPVATPENMRAGVDTRFANSALKGDDGKLYVKFLNPRTGEEELVAPDRMVDATIAFPNELRDPSRRHVRAIRRGRMGYFPREEVDYAFPRMEQAFGPLANLVPMKSGIKGQRLAMGARMSSQALPLVGAEAPLVQNLQPDADSSYEEAYGVHMGAVRADGPGWVKDVTEDGVVVEGADGRARTYDLSRHVPTNRKTGYHQTPTVRVGQEVRPGDLIARSNYTDERGATALGRNVRIAMVPGFGEHSNYEDAWVVSRSGAEKFRSEHYYQHAVEPEDGRAVGKRDFLAAFPAKYARKVLDNFGDDGVIKVGSRVEEGDPLVLSVKARDPGRTQVYRGRGPSLVDATETWDHHTPGVVTDVVNGKAGVKVVVRTEAAAEVGDKLCLSADHDVLTANRGWVPIADVDVFDRVACLRDGELVYREPTATHRYASGGRMYRIASQQVDLFVTAGHRMYVQPRGRSSFSLLTAASIAGKRVSYKKDAAWNGRTPGRVKLDDHEVRCGRGGVAVKTVAGLEIPTTTYLKLLGAFLSEGNTFRGKNCSGIDVHQTKAAGRERFERELLPELEACGLHAVVRPEKYRINSKGLREHFARFGLCYDKFIPEEVFSYGREALEHLFSWLMWGDGTSGRLPVSYTTTSARLADDVQRLCLHIGKAANIDVTEADGPVLVNGKWCVPATRYDVRIINKKTTPQVNHGHVKRQKAQTEGFVEDYRGPVYCLSVPGEVFYVRRNGKPVWTGNSNRFGGKGVIASIVPDEKMPRDEEGNVVDLLFNPAGVITRGNASAALEVALGKIAARTGRPYKIRDFDGIDDLAGFVQSELEKHGVSDEGHLVDPASGRKIPGVMTGSAFFMKLHHMSADKHQGRGTGGYTQDMQPSKGSGPNSAKRLALMSLNALLSHGATETIKDGLVVRGSANPDYWARFMSGHTPPLPEVPFVHRKFVHQLKASGINVVREGSRFKVHALRGRDVDALAEGRTLRNAETADWKEGLKEVPGGLFDVGLTGGHGGNKWSQIELAEPIVSPVFEEPARRLLGLTEQAYRDVIAGKGEFRGRTGPSAIVGALKSMDLKGEIERARRDLESGRKTGRDDAARRLRYLKAAERDGIHPGDWAWDKVPVLPPVFRPVSASKGTGRPLVADANVLYGELFEADKLLRAMTGKVADLGPERLAVYDAVKAVVGLDDPIHPKTAERGVKGILKEVVGSSPKHGVVQRKLLSAPVDLVGRSVIVPDPDLDLDSVGIPEDHAWDVYRPFIVRRLVRRGAGPLAAARAVKDRDRAAREALLAEMGERPVILDRAPVLHRYGVLAFKPKLVKGDAIRMSPLVTSGFGADFDGDQMNYQVPSREAAVREAYEKLLPSRNLIAPSNFKVHQLPSREYAAGLWLSTRRRRDGRVLTFASAEDAVRAYRRGEIDADQAIEVARP